MTRQQTPALSERLIAFIARYEREQGSPPTLREIAEAAGVSHTTVLLWLKRLVKAGRLTQNGQGGRIYSALGVTPGDMDAESSAAMQVLRAAQRLPGEITSEALVEATGLPLARVRDSLETLRELGFIETVNHRFIEGKHQFIYAVKGEV
ncbi:MAG: helix-turn-helix domain-containing protein [Anaerolineae bacterium]|nr:helix-turn-helix domain-containing protein [Anaerolineae bacterium]